jgi:electron transfer flavoprotein-quinone oxidoreductase
MKRQTITPYQLLEGLKQHTAVKPLIEGAEMKEYSAHLIPEGGLKALPQLYGDGWLVVGDSAGFVNGIHREGSNLAMTSGRLAAEAIVALKASGKALDAGNLAEYKRRLDASVIIADLKKYADVPEFLHKKPHIIDLYPRVLGNSMHEMFMVDGQSKRAKQQKIFNELRSKRSLLGLLGDAYQFWRAFR